VNCTITCHEDFYLDKAVGYCRPHCGRWEAYPSTLQPVRDALVIISAACGIIAGIAVVVLAYFRHRKVWVVVKSIYIYVCNFITACKRESIAIRWEFAVSVVDQLNEGTSIPQLVLTQCHSQCGRWLGEYLNILGCNSVIAQRLQTFLYDYQI